MSNGTKIGWTDETWNPVVGCSPASPGCDHCYAAVMAKRLAAMGLEAYEKVKDWDGSVAFAEAVFEKPLHWKRPRNIFVCSMADLFHENVPFEWIDRVFVVMAATPHHHYQILTKRPDRMREYCLRFASDSQWFENASVLSLPHVRAVRIDGVLPNVSLGVTVENQEMADLRIPILLDTPAAKRFLSIEPLLVPVDLEAVYGDDIDSVYCPSCHAFCVEPLESCSNCNKPLDGCECEIEHRTDYSCDHCGHSGGHILPPAEWAYYSEQDRHGELLTALDGVIVGGESGPGARPMHPDWVRSIRDQCEAAGTPFFFKQWGEWVECSLMQHEFARDGRRLWGYPDGTWHVERCPLGWRVDSNPKHIYMQRVGKRNAGRELDGQTYNALPWSVSS